MPTQASFQETESVSRSKSTRPLSVGDLVPDTVAKTPPDTEVLSDRHVGRLFMDEGHEEVLIRILEKVRKEDLGACMRICGNAHRTIVGTASLQLRLRRLLYRVDPKEETAADVSKSSAEAVKELIKRQSRIEHLDYRLAQAWRIHPVGQIHTEIQFIDAQRAVKVTTSRVGVSIHQLLSGATGTASKLSRNAVAAFDAASGLMVQWYLEPTAGGHGTLLDIRLHDMFDSPGFLQVARPHPLAQKGVLCIALPHETTRRFSMRFHPSGLVGIRVRSYDNVEKIVVLDWHAGNCLGVVVSEGGNRRIADFLLVSRSHVLCLGERTRDARCDRDISLYEIPTTQQQGPTPFGQQLHIDQQTRFSHLSTFRFAPTDLSRHDTSIRMQAILDGESEDGRIISVKFGAGSRCMQGAVLFSRLKTVAAAVGHGSSSRSVATVHDDTTMSRPREQGLVTEEKPIHIRWPDWKSIFHLTDAGHHVSLAHGYRLANLVPDSGNIGRICLFIRDYDPRMLLAPASHFGQNLGDLSQVDKRCSGGWKVKGPCRRKVIRLDPKLFTEDFTSIRLFWAGDSVYVLQSRASEPDRLFAFRSNQ